MSARIHTQLKASQCNLGGEPNMVRLLQSAFFDLSTHMNTIAYTDGRNPKREEQWTIPGLAGIDMLYGVPLYIVTNRQVASAAEDFAYSLQVRKRAVVVGGTTLGAAKIIRQDDACKYLAKNMLVGRPAVLEWLDNDR